MIVSSSKVEFVSGFASSILIEAKMAPTLPEATPPSRRWGMDRRFPTRPARFKHFPWDFEFVSDFELRISDFGISLADASNSRPADGRRWGQSSCWPRRGKPGHGPKTCHAFPATIESPRPRGSVALRLSYTLGRLIAGGLILRFWDLAHRVLPGTEVPGCFQLSLRDRNAGAGEGNRTHHFSSAPCVTLQRRATYASPFFHVVARNRTPLQSFWH